MRKIKQILAVFLIVVITASFTIPDDWYLFESNGFSIEFPKKPNTETQSLTTGIGKLDMEVTLYDASNDKEDNLLYGIISSVYPDSLINSDKKELLPKFFRGSIDGAVKNVNGKLLSEKEIEIDGFPGREARVDYQNGLAIIKMRIYLVHNKTIILQTITETSKESNANALKFHDSFKLKK